MAAWTLGVATVMHRDTLDARTENPWHSGTEASQVGVSHWCCL